jgi:hypothetical protein
MPPAAILDATDPGTAPAEVTKPVFEDIVERAVLQINAICRDATLKFALSVGRVVIENIYSGDLNQWRARNPKKDHSLRKLAKHPGMPMSPNALYRSVAIFELCERLGIASWKHISTTHIRLVLPLATDQQTTLLQAAETNRWPAHRLDEAVAALMHHDPAARENRGGRKRASKLKERMRRIESLTATLNDILEANEDVTAEASADSTRAAINLLHDLAQKCSSLETRLEQSLVHFSATSPCVLPDDKKRD